MQVRLLRKEYLKSDRVYTEFLEESIVKNEENFEETVINLDKAPDFPVYISYIDDDIREQNYIEAFTVLSRNYLELDREIQLDGQFWHSLLLTCKRDYILKTYPEVKESESKFRNIVLKKFDWENYIYKCILGAQYIWDNVDEEQYARYYKLIAQNMDVYNYIIKYSIFRNDKFLINILDIIGDNNLSEILKAKIKGRDDLGKDERYGRRVIFEMNKSYPVIMAPVMEKEELEGLFIENLRKYYSEELPRVERTKV